MQFEDYPIHVDPISEDEGGGYLVTIPDLPGCVADGETIDAAVAEARDAFRAGRRPNGKTRAISPRRRPGADSSSSASPGPCACSSPDARRARESA